MTALISATVMIATAIQGWASVIELGRANRPAVDWWDAEDQLVAEHPRRRRRRVRRDLKTQRDAQIHTEIRRVQLTLFSWVLLLVASGVAFVSEVAPGDLLG